MTETLQRESTAQGADRSPVQIRKLGHVVYRVRDIARSVQFYTDILNFRVSDVNERGMVFLNACGDHHTIALMQADAGSAATHPPSDQLGLSHFAMEVGSLDELFEIREFLRRRGIAIKGEGRKGAGCNIGVELLDPDGYTVELYCDMDQIGANNRTRPAGQWHRVNSLEAARDNPLPRTW